MPRNYVRTSDRGSYGAELLEEAVQKVRSGEISGYDAAAAYSVPRTTIMDRVSGRHGTKSSTMGKPRAVPQPVEKQLVDTLRFMQLRGFHSGYKELTNLIGDYLVEKQIQGFQLGKPSVFWVRAFLARHHLNKSSVEKQNATLNKHFCMIEDTLEEFDLSEHPDRIWCLREHHFTINEDGCVVSVAPEDVNATVVTACNAAGRKAPMLIVLKDNLRLADGGVCHASTENGRLDQKVFTAYFTDNFLDKMRAPFLVIYNGNTSSIGIKLIEDARERGVIFVKSPSFYRDVTADLRDKWHKDLRAVTNKDQFIAIIKRGYTEFGAAQIRFGFKKVGISTKARKNNLEFKAGNDKNDAGGESNETSCVDMDAVIPVVVIIKDDDDTEHVIEIENELTVVVEEDSSAESSKNTRDCFNETEAAPSSTSTVEGVKSSVKPTVNPKPTPLAPSTSTNDPAILRKRIQNSVGTEPFDDRSG